MTIVATVLTVYGIETFNTFVHHLIHNKLQQYLPFTVLKRINIFKIIVHDYFRCNSTYRLRY